MPRLRSLFFVAGGLAFLPVPAARGANTPDFYRLYRSPYFLGRGDTGIATADNHEAIFYNPAGLARGKGLYKETVLLSPAIDVSIKTKDLVRQVLIEKTNDTGTLKNYLGRNLHLGVSNFTGAVFRRMALGVVASSQSNIMLAKSKVDRGLETLHADTALNRVVVLSVAESFWNQNLHVGLTGKYIMRNEASIDVSAIDSSGISDQLKANDVQIPRNGAGVDLGILYQMEKSRWSYGLHVENLGSTNLAGASAAGSSRLPQITSLGIAYEMGTKVSTMTTLVDFRDITGTTEKNSFKRLHIGGELQFARFFGFIGGLNQGYPTAGLFVNLYVARLDIGAYTEEVGDSVGIRPDQRLYFRLKAGF